jgi:transcription-repair coupling factor (superfamily II helicase)
LETIAENTQLGAGFSIAMRDLEIRGAGDLLGTRQHGHIAAVGFHLYTRLLADAIRRLRSSSPLPAQQPGSPFSAYDSPLGNPVNVDLVMPVGIPAEYIADREARLRLYRRIANVRSLTELEALMDEFVDRFGVPPEPVRNLLFQLKIKLLAEHAGAVSVNGEGGQIVVRFAALPEGINSRFFPDLGSEIRSGKNTLWLQSSQGWEERLENALRLIAGKSPEIIHPG